jgi:VanZ family protein
MGLRWLALVVWLVVILFNSSVPGAPMPTSGLLSTLISKVGHLVEYGVLAWLAWRALLEPRVGILPRSLTGFALVLGAGLIFAGLDELRQFFVPGRGSSPLDSLLDLVALTMSLTLLQRTARGSEPHTSQELAGEDGQEKVHR